LLTKSELRAELVAKLVILLGGVPVKLSSASSMPIEQRVTTIKKLGLNMPDWENELSFMEIPFYFWFYFSFYIYE